MMERIKGLVVVYEDGRREQWEGSGRINHVKTLTTPPGKKEATEPLTHLNVSFLPTFPPEPAEAAEAPSAAPVEAVSG